MALTVTGAQLISSIRKFADVNGTSALARHPNADLYDYLNRALGSLHRKLVTVLPDQRFLSSSTTSITSGTTAYSLPADFHHLISVDLTMNGSKRWIEAYEMNERAVLTDPASATTGTPWVYRLRGSNIELLPSPTTSGSFTIWYVPTPTQFATDGSQSANLWDTIDRLDEYLIAYAARIIATRDKKLDLAGVCKSLLDELEGEIRVTARARDKNSPSRIIDTSFADRCGSSLRSRRWR